MMNNSRCSQPLVSPWVTRGHFRVLLMMPLCFLFPIKCSFSMIKKHVNNMLIPYKVFSHFWALLQRKNMESKCYLVEIGMEA